MSSAGQWNASERRDRFEEMLVSSNADALLTPKNAGMSILIPAWNEENAIEETITHILNAIQTSGAPFEIIVIDDGSKDQTAFRAESMGVKVVQHRHNRGYGAALKTGLGFAKYPWIVIADADGTYPLEDIPRLMEECDHHDMVVGARTGEDVHVPIFRRFAKYLLRVLAYMLLGHRIPDLNSGMRIFRRSLAHRFMPLFPDGFSFTSTITIASLANGYRVKYLPINYKRRIGKSSIRPLRDFLGFSLLVVRLTACFKPLNVFLPLTGILFSIGITKAIIDITRENHIGVGAAVVLLASVQIFCFAILADLMTKRTTL